MGRVVVVGGGLAGTSAAVRLAKLGHAVRLCEATGRVGGQLLPRRSDDHDFDLWPASLTMPATLRDLFRKSGRPLDRVVDLHHLVPGRRHLMPGGVVLDLPMGRRGDQVDAINVALPGQGEVWAGWLDGRTDAWEALRRTTLDRRLAGRSDLDKAAWAALRPRRTLAREVRRALRDDSLASLVVDPVRADGDDPRAVPAYTSVSHLVERSFGRWRVDGGAPALVAALETRLRERRVEVLLGVRAHRAVVGDGAVRGVETDDGLLEADVVVWAAPDPDPDASSGVPRMPAARTLVRLAPGVESLPAEVLVHTDPPLRLWASSSDPEGSRCWTIAHRTQGGEDVLSALARVGLDVRAHVEHREDLSPVDLVRAHGAAACGWHWSGWRSAFDRPGVGETVDGLLTVGVDAHPGPSPELVLMGTAAAAEAVGKA
ncbi:phytoene desaturase family protein [Solicola sp. PLA-1-18]|uniref:phytoene desaturase family protein n=1 Tax=Solicola sp. PLA-1-18 TaxID=3380532 RepID=UPI003B822883